jgi:hypothetical protein
MYGGEISGNAAKARGTNNVFGGGVFCNGTFRIITGIIYGSNEAEGIRNTADVSNGASLYANYLYPEYGTFDGDTWNENGKLNRTNDTIRVVNGVLQQ